MSATCTDVSSVIGSMPTASPCAKCALSPRRLTRTLPLLGCNTSRRIFSGSGSGQQAGSSASTRPFPSSSTQLPQTSPVSGDGRVEVVVVGAPVEVVVVEVEVVDGGGRVVEVVVVLVVVVEVVFFGPPSSVVVVVELVVVEVLELLVAVVEVVDVVLVVVVGTTVVVVTMQGVLTMWCLHDAASA